MFWLAVLVFAVATTWVLARIRRNFKDRARAEEARAANLLAGLVGTAPAAAADPAPRPAREAAPDQLAQQKLLYESACKAGEACEPALAILLYARLLARYPASAFSAQARASAEAQKEKLAKA